MKTHRVFLVLLWAFVSVSCRSAERTSARAPSPNSEAANAGDGAPRADTPEPNVEQRTWQERFAGTRPLSSQHGEASYYSDALAGRSTASGEAYDPRRYTAAHRKLPFGTVLRVVRTDDGRSVYVRVNDRGPFGKRRRIVDLSRSAAEQLGLLGRGVADVRLEIVEAAHARAR